MEKIEKVRGVDILESSMFNRLNKHVNIHTSTVPKIGLNFKEELVGSLTEQIWMLVQRENLEQLGKYQIGSRIDKESCVLGIIW